MRMTINWNKRTYTEQEFIDAWLGSESIAECIRKLELSIFGSTYATLKGTAKELNLPSDHMLGQGHLKGKTHNWTNSEPLEVVLVKGRSTSTYHLKNRLWKEGVLQKKCQWCDIREWNGLPAPLQLDHINGIRDDNRIENLRILCANCHAQTDTWTGKNKMRV